MSVTQDSLGKEPNVGGNLSLVGGGDLAKIKENEAKMATLGVARGASHPLLTCGYVSYCIWGN